VDKVITGKYSQTDKRTKVLPWVAPALSTLVRLPLGTVLERFVAITNVVEKILERQVLMNINQT
jgi:hypothetical protein